MYEAPNTPTQLAAPELTSVQTTPSQAGAAAVHSQAAVLQEMTNQAVLGSLDIKDPSQATAAAGASTAAPTTTGASPPATSPAAASPTFPDELLRRAWEMGIGADEARQYGTPENLDRSLSALDRALGRLAQRTPAADPRFQQPPPDPALDPRFQPPPGELDGPPQLDPEVFDEQLVGAWNEQQAYYEGLLQRQQAMIEQLSGTVQQTLGHVQSRQAAETQRSLDGLFAQAPPEYREVLGDGTRFQLPEHSPQYQSRMAVLHEMDALERGYQVTGRRPPPPDQLFQRALRAVHGDRAVQGAQRQVADRLRSSTGQFIARPTGTAGSNDRAPDNPDMRDKWAAERLATRMREMNFQVAG